MAEMSVELVAVERPVWSGQASSVFAVTTVGELGILPGHTPLLGVLAEGNLVRLELEGGEEVRAAVHGGFLSVTADGVQVLAERAELADDIDVSRARAAYDRNKDAAADDADGQAALLRAKARLQAAGETVD